METQITQEQIDAIKEAFIVVKTTLENFYEVMMEAVRKIARVLNEFLARLQVYHKLRSVKFPPGISLWISLNIPKRFVIMC